MASENVIIAFNEIPGIGGTTAIGLKILAFMMLVDVCRETFNFIRGAQADFVGVLGRGLVSAALISLIPVASIFISQAVLGISDQLFAQGKTTLMTQSFRAAMKNFRCEDVGLTQIFSATGLMLCLSQFVLYVSMIIKFFVIDVLWPLMFSLTVYLGVLTIPVTFLRELGGLANYLRHVISVALWPVVFAFLTVLMSVTFPKTLAQVSSGEVTIECKALIDASGDEGAAAATNGSSPSSMPSSGSASSPLNGSTDAGAIVVLKYLALCLGFVFLTWKTPMIAGMAVGETSPEGITGQMSSLSARVAGGALSPARAGANSAGKAVGKAAGRAALKQIRTAAKRFRG